MAFVPSWPLSSLYPLSNDTPYGLTIVSLLVFLLTWVMLFSTHNLYQEFWTYISKVTQVHEDDSKKEPSTLLAVVAVSPAAMEA